MDKQNNLDNINVKKMEAKKIDAEKPTSIEKALNLLYIFVEPPYEYTLPQLVKKTGMNRTTLYRNLSSLLQSCLLMCDEQGKYYKIGPLAYRMGSIYLINANYEERVLAILEKIAEESSESVGLARREGEKIVSIYSVEIHQPTKMNDKPGVFYPINKGTYGKCLMAYYDQGKLKVLLEKSTFEKTCKNTIVDKDELLLEYERIRKQGFVLSIEETFPYVIGVGIPIADSKGNVKNVVAISFFKHDNYLEKIEECKALLFKYQSELSKYIL
ncbi:MAG: IclR family transcriptional regulator C-terminal domain-containing protein [Eubacteriales bacterium]